MLKKAKGKLMGYVVCLVVICLVILLPASGGYTAAGLDDREELETFMSGLVNGQLEEQKIPGAALSLVKDGEVILLRGYGEADLEVGQPVDGEQSLFRIGSVAKLITWTAVMQLVEKGQVDLDRDVNAYLDFEIPDRLLGRSGADPAPITMRHLLTHTPGFEDVGEGLFVLSEDAVNPLGEHLQQYMPARVYPAGEVMAYSNYGSALAGYIVELVSGQPFAAYVEENIFEPLGMDDSTFRQPLPADLSARLVRAYKYADGTYHEGGFEYIPMYPAGSMSSTAADMARFMLAHLQEGHKLLEQETVREMHRQQFTHHPGLPGITFGFIEEERNGEKLLVHNGATMLYFSFLYLMPEHNLGLFVSYSGGDYLQGMHLFQDFLDRYFPGDDPEVLPAPPTDARERLGAYLGEYHPTRISYTSPDRFIGLLQAQRLELDEAGYLSANVQGEALKFVEVEPGLYKNIDPGENELIPMLALTTGPEGRPLLATGAATYSKAPWYETLTFNGGLLLIVLLLIILTLGGWTTAFLWRRIKGRKGEVSRGARLARLTAVSFSLLTLLYLLGTMLVFTDIDPAYGVPRIIFGIITPPLQFVFALPWILALLTPVMIGFAVLAWKNGYWTRGGRIHYSLFAAASTGLIWILAYLNMI